MSTHEMTDDVKAAYDVLHASLCHYRGRPINYEDADALIQHLAPSVASALNRAAEPAPETPALASREPGTLAEVLTDEVLNHVYQEIEVSCAEGRLAVLAIVQPLVDGLTQRIARVTENYLDTVALAADQERRAEAAESSRDALVSAVQQFVTTIESDDCPPGPWNTNAMSAFNRLKALLAAASSEREATCEICGEDVGYEGGGTRCPKHIYSPAAPADAGQER